MSAQHAPRAARDWLRDRKPFTLDIIKTGGVWRYIVRGVSPHVAAPGYWITEVNAGLSGAEDIAKAIVDKLNQEDAP